MSRFAISQTTGATSAAAYDPIPIRQNMAICADQMTVAGFGSCRKKTSNRRRDA